MDVGYSFFVIPDEKFGGYIPALVAIDAGEVVVVFSGDVFRVLVGVISHEREITRRF